MSFKSIFFKIFSFLLINAVLLVIMFFVAISLHSKKFPPSLKTTNEYANLLLNAKENYIKLVNKSQNHINMETLDPVDTPVENSTITAQSANLEDLNVQISRIKSQLNRIEQQNNLILNSLKK